MLNVFPDLLILSFFAPLLLRIAAAITLFWGARYVWKHREAIAGLRLPIIGTQKWVPYFTIAAHVILGLMLFFGWYTQIAALVGAALCIKGLVLKGSYSQLFPLSRGSYALLMVIFLSLLLTGAGALAYDIPL